MLIIIFYTIFLNFIRGLSECKEEIIKNVKENEDKLRKYHLFVDKELKDDINSFMKCYNFIYKGKALSSKFKENINQIIQLYNSVNLKIIKLNDKKYNQIQVYIDSIFNCVLKLEDMNHEN